MLAKKMIPIFVMFGVVLLLAIGVGAFYIAPYAKGNECITYVNKNLIDTSLFDKQNGGWISLEDYQELQIVSEEMLEEQYLVEVHTESDYQTVAWNKVAITYEINAEVIEYSDWTTVADYQQSRQIIFLFKRGVWCVETVV